MFQMEARKRGCKCWDHSSSFSILGVCFADDDRTTFENIPLIIHSRYPERIRHLRDILPDRNPLIILPLVYRLDWFHSSFPPAVRRKRDRTSLRCWLRVPAPMGWIFSRRVRSDDVESLLDILGSCSRSSSDYGHWSWNALRARCCHTPNILQHSHRRSHWTCCCRR